MTSSVMSACRALSTAAFAAAVVLAMTVRLAVAEDPKAAMPDVQSLGPQVGAHARSAFGVAQIPMGACVEIELIAEVA